MAKRALEKMHDDRIALKDKLTSQDGKNSFGRNEDAHEKTKKAHVTNDPVENKFAVSDFVMRTFRGVSTHNASGIVQQRSAHDFDRPVKIVSDRRKRKADSAEPEPAVGETGGFFWTILNTQQRSSLLDFARRENPHAIATARKDRRAHDEEKLARREEALQRQLNVAVDRYAEALELFDQWRSQGVRTQSDLDRTLQGKSVPAQLAELRRQVEMRTVALGWTQFSTKWSFFADERAHTLEQLRQMLLQDVLPFEATLRRNKQLPTTAVPPHLSERKLKSLGTADLDALRLESQGHFNVERLLERAEAARVRREAQGISDSVEAAQPPVPPPFDINLVGKRLEVCWPYHEEGKTTNIWASGTVKRVADGLTDKRSPRARKVLPAGALLWGWDADPDFDEQAGEEWLILIPEKWNKHVQYAWRFDPCELAASHEPKPPPRCLVVDAYASDEEYLPSDDDM